MKSVHLLMLGISLLTGVLGFAQDITPLQNIDVQLFRYSENRSPEKTYIHTDKDVYLIGETIWYKTYLVDGISHSISDKSKVVYVELVSALDSVLVKQKLLNENFGVAGNIELNEALEPGDYTLRAYTKYMLNEKEPVIFSKQITIWRPNNDNNQTPKKVKEDEAEVYNVLQNDLVFDFYPEGGNLVYGIQNTMGIKVTDTQGNEIATSGKIIDQNNTLIKDFETHEFGLGKFSYLPEIGSSYYASVNVNGQEKKFALPIPEKEGYVLNVVQNTEQITIKVTSNIADALKGALLIGHMRGRVFLQHTKEFHEPSYLVRIPIEEVADGVAHFTLFTANGEPVCERLVFIDHPDNDNLLNITTAWPVYNKRQKVDVELGLESMAGEALVGSFSAAVISEAGLNNTFSNIESWLLLNSDVGGTIDNASFFFEEASIKKRFLLDALMLTHGWRRFVWKTMLNENISQGMPLEPEKGIMISGRTTDFKNKYQPKPSSVRFSVMGSALFDDRITTDANGNFNFGPYVFQDTLKAIIQSKALSSSNKREMANDFNIFINDNYPKIPFLNRTKTKKNNFLYKPSEEYAAIASLKNNIDFDIDPKTIKLNEVSVAAKLRMQKSLNEQNITKFARYSEPNKRIYMDSMTIGAFSIHTVIGNSNIAGLVVKSNRDGTKSIEIRQAGSLFINADGNTASKGGPPLFLLDGVQVLEEDVRQLSPFDVEIIDVLKGANAALYPSGINGVVAIYTKRGGNVNSNNNKSIPNITNFTLKGFHKTREFYSPRYDQPKVEHKLQDFRTTLHWQPNIIINENGTSAMSFFTGDVPGKYIIHVEGITAQGIPISEIQTFEVDGDQQN